MNTTLTLKIIAPLAIVFALLVATNFIYAAWDKPNDAAPEGNVAAPINTSINGQAKQGRLSVATSWIASKNPFLKFGDEDGVSWSIFVNDNQMRFMNYVDETRWLDRLTITSIYAKFAGHLRAPAYCDPDGNNCIDLSIRCTEGQVLVANADGGWQCGDLGSNSTSGTSLVSLDRQMQQAAALIDYDADIDQPANWTSPYHPNGAAFYADDQTAEKICDLYAGDSTAKFTGYSVTAFDSPEDNVTDFYSGSEGKWYNVPSEGAPPDAVCQSKSICEDPGCPNPITTWTCDKNYNSLINILTCEVPN